MVDFKEVSIIPTDYFITSYNRLLTNPHQKEALEHNDSMVLLAGPGSGKTATLTVKIMILLQEIKYPQGLACVTFNNDAVIEFRDRLKKMGLQLRRNIFLGTFHSFCMWDLLRPFGRI